MRQLQYPPEFRYEEDVSNLGNRKAFHTNDKTRCYRVVYKELDIRSVKQFKRKKLTVLIIHHKTIHKISNMSRDMNQRQPLKAPDLGQSHK